MEFFYAPDIEDRIKSVVKNTELEYIDCYRVKCFRSYGSKSRARARIWSFPKIWQQALNIKPHYIIEVISEKFDRMGITEQDKVLIHELLHIPKNFSGSLLPHRGRGRAINDSIINKLFNKYKKND